MPRPNPVWAALSTADVQRRLAFTLCAILVFRLGCQVATPGVDAAAMARLVQENAGGVLGFFNLFSGGALERCSIFALGLQPFINASIIMQLLVHVIPALEHVQKEEGEEGREKIERWTRWFAMALATVQAYGVCVLLEQWSLASRAGSLVLVPGWRFRVTAVTALTLGSAFVMWMSSQMTRRGVGNGASILIVSGIVARAPAAVLTAWHRLELDQGNPLGWLNALALAGGLALAVAAVVAVQDAVRRIPLAHTRRVIGRRLECGTTAHIPLRLNEGGVMPVIFASSVLMLPATLWSWPMEGWPFQLAELALIIFFAYFYAAMRFDPAKLAASLRKAGSFMPGIRAGRQTAAYLDRVLARITLAGGVYLGIITLLLQRVGLGGTSLLIVVGATLETLRQVESLALARQFDSFKRL